MSPAFLAPLLKLGLAGAAIAALLYVIKMQDDRARDDRTYNVMVILQALDDAEKACKVPEHERTPPPKPP